MILSPLFIGVTLVFIAVPTIGKEQKHSHGVTSMMKKWRRCHSHQGFNGSANPGFKKALKFCDSQHIQSQECWRACLSQEMGLVKKGIYNSKETKNTLGQFFHLPQGEDLLNKWVNDTDECMAIWKKKGSEWPENFNKMESCSSISDTMMCMTKSMQCPPKNGNGKKTKRENKKKKGSKKLKKATKEPKVTFKTKASPMPKETKKEGEEELKTGQKINKTSKGHKKVPSLSKTYLKEMKGKRIKNEENLVKNKENLVNNEEKWVNLEEKKVKNEEKWIKNEEKQKPDGHKNQTEKQKKIVESKKSPTEHQNIRVDKQEKMFINNKKQSANHGNHFENPGKQFKHFGKQIKNLGKQFRNQIEKPKRLHENHKKLYETEIENKKKHFKNQLKKKEIQHEKQVTNKKKLNELKKENSKIEEKISEIQGKLLHLKKSHLDPNLDHPGKNHSERVKYLIKQWKCHPGFMEDKFSPQSEAAFAKCDDKDIKEHECFKACFATELGIMDAGFYNEAASRRELEYVFKFPEGRPVVEKWLQANWNCVQKWEAEGHVWPKHFHDNCRDIRTLATCVAESRKCKSDSFNQRHNEILAI